MCVQATQIAGSLLAPAVVVIAPASCSTLMEAMASWAARLCFYSSSAKNSPMLFSHEIDPHTSYSKTLWSILPAPPLQLWLLASCWYSFQTCKTLMNTLKIQQHMRKKFRILGQNNTASYSNTIRLIGVKEHIRFYLCRAGTLQGGC